MRFLSLILVFLLGSHALGQEAKKACPPGLCKCGLSCKCADDGPCTKTAAQTADTVPKMRGVVAGRYGDRDVYLWTAPTPRILVNTSNEGVYVRTPRTEVCVGKGCGGTTVVVRERRGVIGWLFRR